MAIHNRQLRLLLLYWFEDSTAHSVLDIVNYLSELSCCKITCLNLRNDLVNQYIEFYRDALNLTRYDGIIFHNSLTYHIENIIQFDKQFDFNLKSYPGIKVIFKQDDNMKFRIADDVFCQFDIDLVFTCLKPTEVHKVYPKAQAAGTQFVNMLTGYVTPNLRQIQSKKWNERTIDVGYRGSIQPISFGRLCYEKRQIGDFFANLVVDQDLQLDISSRWEDRIYGENWLQFLANCKATLGVESGASIFDLDGSVDKRINEVSARHASLSRDSDHEVLEALKDLEHNVDYAQISPRHFEAAATKTLQIMYPGSYSGIFEANRHYVVLERDGSNIHEVIDVFRNKSLSEAIIERAYSDIILNEQNWIETFVQKFDNWVCNVYKQKIVHLPFSQLHSDPIVDILLLISNQSDSNPKANYIANDVPSGFRVHQFGISLENAEAYLPCIASSLEESLDVSLPCRDFQSAIDNLEQALAYISQEDIRVQIYKLIYYASLSPVDFAAAVGEKLSNLARLVSLQNDIRRIVSVSGSLIADIYTSDGIDLIIAMTFDALPAGIIGSRMLNIPIIYDAASYWPAVGGQAELLEQNFLTKIECNLLKYCNLYLTDSDAVVDTTRDSNRCFLSDRSGASFWKKIGPSLNYLLQDQNSIKKSYPFQWHPQVAYGVRMEDARVNSSAVKSITQSKKQFVVDGEISAATALTYSMEAMTIKKPTFLQKMLYMLGLKKRIQSNNLNET